MYARGGSDGNTYSRVAYLAKAHARIIWDCAWSQDGRLFATASRDKQVKIWEKSRDGSEWKNVATLVLPDAATSVAFTLQDGR